MAFRLPTSPQHFVAALHADQKGAPTIRKYLLALPAILIVISILAASAPVEARSRMALGVWMPEGNRNPDVYIDFAASISPSSAPLQNAPAIWNASSQWGREETKRFPLEMARAARANRAVLMLTWSPVKPPFNRETGEFSRFQRIASGKHDTYIRNFARRAKKVGGPVFLRFAHEINVRYFPWTEHWGKFYDPATGERSRNNDNNPTKFKKAWKRVYNIFQRVGARNVKFLWTVARETCRGCNPYDEWYPGDKFVHYIGFSSFNWGSHFGGTYTSFMHGIKQPMQKLTFTKKPIIIAELATTDEEREPGYGKPEWLWEGYHAVYRNYPRIKAIVYQNVDLAHLGHPNWSLYSPAAALPKYQQIASKSLFKGRVNNKGQIK